MSSLPPATPARRTIRPPLPTLSNFLEPTRGVSFAAATGGAPLTASRFAVGDPSVARKIVLICLFSAPLLGGCERDRGERTGAPRKSTSQAVVRVAAALP